MRKALFLAAAVSLSATLAPLNAQAFPVSPSDSAYGSPNLTLVEGGCGYGYHRGAYGGCRPNRRDWDGDAGPGPGPGIVLPIPGGGGVVVAPGGYGSGYGPRRCWMRPTPYGPERVCNY